jgi:hypothetical protein
MLGSAGEREMHGIEFVMNRCAGACVKVLRRNKLFMYNGQGVTERYRQILDTSSTYQKKQKCHVNMCPEIFMSYR